jgi:hypothetical protein
MVLGTVHSLETRDRQLARAESFVRGPGLPLDRLGLA